MSKWFFGRARSHIAAGAALAVLSVVTVFAPARAATVDCADVFLMFGRGSGQSVGSSGETDAFFAEVQERIDADVTIATRELGADSYDGHQYPAVGGFINMIEAEASWLGGPLGGEYRDSVSEGIDEATAYLNDRAVACPNEVWVLGGYSQGAQVMGATLFQLSDSARENIVFTALFGDPKLKTNGKGPFPPACRGDQYEWVRGNVRCYHDGGVLEPRDPYLPSDLESRVGSWCDKQDGICTGNPLLVGNDAHSQYPDSEIPEAAREIAERLADRLPERRDSFDVSFLPIGIGTAGFDLAFVIDTTGSMSGDLASAKASSQALGEAVIEGFTNGRVAVTQYRDHGDPFVARIETGLTSDVATFQAALDRLFASGGGDYPEAVLSGVMTTLNGLEWRDGATKVAVIIGDAPGKDPEPITGFTSAQVLQRALEIDPVNLYGVVTRGGSDVESFFQTLADGSEGLVFRLDSGQSLADLLLEAVGTISTRSVVVTGGFYAAAPGQTIRFSAAGSYDPDSTITQYNWDFDNDGTTDATTTEPFADHAYPAPYDGLAVVRVTSADGDTGNGTMEVLVSETGLAALQPGAPAAVSAAPGAGPGEVEVTWQPPAGGAAVDGYRVYREDGALVAVRGGAERSVAVAGVPEGESVRFRVVAVNDFGEGPDTLSNPVTLGARYEVDAFGAPIEEPPVWNEVRGGRAVPVKWTAVDPATGLPVNDASHFVVVRSIRVACPDNTAEVNDVPEDGATSSGLLALGDGAWQANWKTSSTWAGTCRRMDLVLDDGVTAGRSALFIFRG